jgi:hypothetical protein
MYSTGIAIALNVPLLSPLSPQGISSHTRSDRLHLPHRTEAADFANLPHDDPPQGNPSERKFLRQTDSRIDDDTPPVLLLLRFFFLLAGPSNAFRSFLPPSLPPSLQQNSSKTTASRARKQSGNCPTNLLPFRCVFFLVCFSSPHL